ncbi:probable ribonuclease 11 [Mustela nigripes]|uniref:Probable ribonuclease 11 n=1 Tax=Mustela putorius furo TaxID=9669 RepID=M3Z3V7_MUSPF|nr:probable ribonuclease 11 [Mustela putorius furo]XP_059227079.1 probable ribonuclease 11 [Mustela nigripes]
METFSLLLLSLGLVLTGASESIMEIIKEESSRGEMKYDLANRDQEKQTLEVLMNLTLFYKNTSLSLSRGILSSSLLTFGRLHYTFAKGDSPGNDKEYCNDLVAWRKVSEANESCRLSYNFIHGSMEVIHGAPKASSCKYGQNLGTSCSRNPDLDTTMCQLTMGKQFPRCQYQSDTSLKKILAVLTGHSLMSWLVSGSKL